MWIDPDLGCYQYYYLGCDVDRSLAFVYNQDAVDGSNGSSCEGTNTYGENIPILGMDYFRGPRGPKVFKRDKDGNIILDENGNPILLEPIPNTGSQDTVVELGMTSFTYAENCGLPGSSFPPGQCDPQRGREDGFYNYIRGFWVDETPFILEGQDTILEVQILLDMHFLEIQMTVLDGLCVLQDFLLETDVHFKLQVHYYFSQVLKMS